MSNTSDDTGNGHDTKNIAMLDNAQNAQQFLQEKQAALAKLDRAQAPLPWAKTRLDMADAYLALENKAEAWQAARESFDIFLAEEAWQEAVEACNVMYQSEQAGSISALGQGIWLAVTYPIEAQTSVAMLHHVVDDTPKDADGAAVAAATAHYIAGLRSAEGKQESLLFLTTHILGEVAKRHSNVGSQVDFDRWVMRLQLDKPAEFLPRMAKIIDIMVANDWWFDRDELRSRLPNE